MNNEKKKSDKAKIAMDTAIWGHGRKKATLTIAINKLKQTDLANHPDVITVIKLLEKERQKLKNSNPLEL